MFNLLLQIKLQPVGPWSYLINYLNETNDRLYLSEMVLKVEYMFVFPCSGRVANGKISCSILENTLVCLVNLKQFIKSLFRALCTKYNVYGVYLKLTLLFSSTTSTK